MAKAYLYDGTLPPVNPSTVFPTMIPTFVNPAEVEIAQPPDELSWHHIVYPVQAFVIMAMIPDFKCIHRVCRRLQILYDDVRGLRECYFLTKPPEFGDDGYTVQEAHIAYACRYLDLLGLNWYSEVLLGLEGTLDLSMQSPSKKLHCACLLHGREDPPILEPETSQHHPPGVSNFMHAPNSEKEARSSHHTLPDNINDSQKEELAMFYWIMNRRWNEEGDTDAELDLVGRIEAATGTLLLRQH
ncbi:hypothetical protein M426DRAFT_16125 [Hypoxylon sp. CI-4A]|nr:hypothetical protein M426DRAFT_16125 [Hypoxylon sp. CI-4A]